MAFSLYKEAGVNIESISQDSNLSTGVAGIMIDENGNNAINVFAGAAAHLQNDDIDTNLDVIKKIKDIFNSNGNSRLNNYICFKKS
jgi:ribokinase